MDFQPADEAGQPAVEYGWPTAEGVARSAYCTKRRADSTAWEDDVDDEDYEDMPCDHDANNDVPVDEEEDTRAIAVAEHYTETNMDTYYGTLSDMEDDDGKPTLPVV